MSTQRHCAITSPNLAYMAMHRILARIASTKAFGFLILTTSTDGLLNKLPMSAILNSLMLVGLYLIDTIPRILMATPKTFATVTKDKPTNE